MKNESRWCNSDKLNKLEDILVDAASIITLLRGFDECSDQLNSLMDSYGNIYRCCLLSGIEGNVLKQLSNHGGIKRFFENIITIARYSSQPGRSCKLIRHVMNDLKASQINELKKVLITRQQSMTKDSLDENRLSTQNALEWVSALPTPIRLQRLASSIQSSTRCRTELCGLFRV